LEKNTFYDGMRKIFKLVDSEKADDEINRIIDKTFEKFKDLVKDI
jgi:hypothetical protein